MATADKGPYYTSEDGTLHVWTGTGYHAIPKIAAGDVGDIYTTPGAYTNVTPNGDGYQPPDMTEVWQGYGIKDYAKYGLPDSTKNFGGGALANYQQGSGDPEYLDYLLKSDDKVGTNIKFTKQGDYWVPEFAGAQGWDTNNSAQNMALLSIAAGPLLSYAGQALSGVPGASSFGTSGGLLNSVDDMLFSGVGAAGSGLGAAGTAATGAANAAPGNMTSYGVLDTSFALPGTQITPFAGAAPSPMTTYGTLDKSFALPGTEFTPFAGAGGLGSVSDIVKAIGPGNLVKGGLTLAGGLLGGAGGDDNKTTGTAPGAAVVPGTIPKMYGGAGMIGNYGPMGPTETERRMRKEYLPGLLGGKNPWGY